ncbi:hypothetical protein BU26DRAFT_554243 [Trematosphaeria pertusa]|uniref:Histone chaperone domain-containing protein n=1 Tax=Trematosphaeria pertusa TaxID=390896 RepID=A0A6A6I197_9PLEO|nr:uncharacterized protein BU26DRAFT_554243 [Trematosphaeria pertusa]KAF2244225.1 hypothetical protein BU26DRAFT_554243 [Trematosphaeria pertusa]
MAAPHYLPVHQQLQTHQQFQVITAIPVSIFNFNKPIINMSASADDQYEQQNDFTNDAPAGDSKDNDYVSRTGQYQVPVQKDEVPVADLYDPVTADSDQQLAQDENDAIDRSNIVEGRTRGATKKAGTYAEPGDEEGLPGADDGTSAIRK